MKAAYHLFRLSLTIIVFLTTNFIHDTLAQEEFIIPPNAQCACRGDVLVYTCTAVGAGSTKWNGTAFNCDSNEIVLRHSLYDNPGGTSGECNGAIVGRSVGFDGIRYTSQLSVTIDERVSSNSTVMCVFNIERVIGTSTLEVVTAAYPPPDDVQVADDYNENNITFNWSSVSPPGCSALSSLHYIITSNGCGECPSITNSTSVTCSNLTVQPDSMCSLSVKSVVCGFEGVASDLLVVTLKDPDVTEGPDTRSTTIIIAVVVLISVLIFTCALIVIIFFAIRMTKKGKKRNTENILEDHDQKLQQ